MKDPVSLNDHTFVRPPLLTPDGFTAGVGMDILTRQALFPRMSRYRNGRPFAPKVPCRIAVVPTGTGDKAGFKAAVQDPENADMAIFAIEPPTRIGPLAMLAEGALTVSLISTFAAGLIYLAAAFVSQPLALGYTAEIGTPRSVGMVQQVLAEPGMLRAKSDDIKAGKPFFERLRILREEQKETVR